MTKMCNVCGYTTEDKSLSECPNCGSYSFRAVKEDRSERFKLNYDERRSRRF